MIGQGTSMGMFYTFMSDMELRNAIKEGGPQTGLLKFLHAQGTAANNALMAGQKDGTITSNEAHQYYASTQSPKMILDALQDGKISLKEFVNIEKAVLTERKMLNQLRRGPEAPAARPNPPAPQHPRHAPQAVRV
jgi:hypothetical protein